MTSLITMAEFPNLGKHCEVDNCGALDFLPFVCDFCKKTFCLEHRQTTEHDCNDFQILCSNRAEKRNSPSVTNETPNCNFRGCVNRELVEIRCEHCKENFCLQHRHQQDHLCFALNDASGKQESKTAALVRQILESKDSIDDRKRSCQGMKSSKTSSLVNLMKIKMKARGDSSLPQNERIYFSVNVYDETDERVATKPFFFSKTWTVGRVIDHLASAEKLKNQNNVANSKKLLLCRSDSSSDRLTMDSTLDNLITTGVLFNGDTVVLRYEL